MKTHFVAPPTRQTPLSVFVEHDYLNRKQHGSRPDERLSRETLEAVRDFVFWLGDNPVISEVSSAMVDEWARTLDESKSQLVPKLRAVLNYADQKGLVRFRSIGGAT